jgi:hypothetical protein
MRKKDVTNQRATGGRRAVDCGGDGGPGCTSLICSGAPPRLRGGTHSSGRRRLLSLLRREQDLPDLIGNRDRSFGLTMSAHGNHRAVCSE